MFDHTVDTRADEFELTRIRFTLMFVAAQSLAHSCILYTGLAHIPQPLIDIMSDALAFLLPSTLPLSSQAYPKLFLPNHPVRSLIPVPPDKHSIYLLRYGVDKAIDIYT